LELLESDPELSIFLEFLNRIDLLGSLDSIPPNQLTILAPTNTAFNSLGSERLDEFRNVELQFFLADVLLYHLVNGTFPSSELMDGQSLPTFSLGFEGGRRLQKTVFDVIAIQFTMIQGMIQGIGVRKTISLLLAQ
jgi:uncharacterized surface protein with fasciclin (FAS1) repeats